MKIKVVQINSVKFIIRKGPRNFYTHWATSKPIFSQSRFKKVRGYLHSVTYTAMEGILGYTKTVDNPARANWR